MDSSLRWNDGKEEKRRTELTGGAPGESTPCRT
jgi:hypothetical protein